jgi:hypothetical protein
VWEGTKARRAIRDARGGLTGDGMALAGIILGIIGFVGAVLVVIFAVWSSSQPRYRY